MGERPRPKARKTARRLGRTPRKPLLPEQGVPVDYALSASQFSTVRAAKPPATIPAWWVNTAIGIFLLPLAGIWTQTFFTCFSRATLHHGFWASEEFWFFALGALLWTIAFFGLPRPLLLYVFGHELTHALWVWAMGGRVSQFKVRRDGGHIVTNMNNFWVALAPYFFPIYSIAVILLYGGVGLFAEVSHYRQLLFGLDRRDVGVPRQFHPVDDTQRPDRPQLPRHVLLAGGHLHDESARPDRDAPHRLAAYLLALFRPRDAPEHDRVFPLGRRGDSIRTPALGVEVSRKLRPASAPWAGAGG